MQTKEDKVASLVNRTDGDKGHLGCVVKNSMVWKSKKILRCIKVSILNRTDQEPMFTPCMASYLPIYILLVVDSL